MESGFRHLAVRKGPAAALDAFCRALFPHECAGCGTEGGVLCDRCRDGVMGPRKGLFACPTCGMATPFGAACGARSCSASPLDGLLSAAPYGDRILRRLLHLWKYERVEEAGLTLAEFFERFLRRHGAAIGPIAAGATVVPVPLAFLRRAVRGFNQSDALAAVLAGQRGATLGRRLLRRASGRPAQAGIPDRRERGSNVAGAFRAAAGVRPGGRYLLVDDVATSSATLRDCARALKAAGAASVWGITLLRG